MAAMTCELCGQWLRLVKPPQHMEGQAPDRLPMHRRVPGAGPICRGSGRAMPLYAKREEQ
jgi:hypothetical protein